MTDFAREISELRLSLVHDTKTMSASDTVKAFEAAIERIRVNPVLSADAAKAKSLFLHTLVLQLLRKECALPLAERVTKRCRRAGFVAIEHRLACEGWFIKVLRTLGENRRAKLIRSRVRGEFLRYCESVGAQDHYRESYVAWLDLPPSPAERDNRSGLTER